MNYQNILIENIKHYRSLLGYTQANLAEAANLSKSAIGQIEISRNAPNFEHLIDIALALHIEPYLLLKQRNYALEDNSSDTAQLAAEIALVLERNKQKKTN
jgi:transcriptional regulator with XRE-family HTH domain